MSEFDKFELDRQIRDAKSRNDAEMRRMRIENPLLARKIAASLAAGEAGFKTSKKRFREQGNLVTGESSGLMEKPTHPGACVRIEQRPVKSMRVSKEERVIAQPRRDSPPEPAIPIEKSDAQKFLFELAKKHNALARDKIINPDKYNKKGEIIGGKKAKGKKKAKKVIVEESSEEEEEEEEESDYGEEYSDAGGVSGHVGDDASVGDDVNMDEAVQKKEDYMEDIVPSLSTSLAAPVRWGSSSSSVSASSFAAPIKVVALQKKTGHVFTSYKKKN